MQSRIIYCEIPQSLAAFSSRRTLTLALFITETHVFRSKAIKNIAQCFAQIFEFVFFFSPCNIEGEHFRQNWADIWLPQKSISPRVLEYTHTPANWQTWRRVLVRFFFFFFNPDIRHEADRAWKTSQIMNQPNKIFLRRILYLSVFRIYVCILTSQFP